MPIVRTRGSPETTPTGLRRSPRLPRYRPTAPPPWHAARSYPPQRNGIRLLLTGPCSTVVRLALFGRRPDLHSRPRKARRPFHRRPPENGPVRGKARPPEGLPLRMEWNSPSAAAVSAQLSPWRRPVRTRRASVPAWPLSCSSFPRRTPSRPLFSGRARLAGVPPHGQPGAECVSQRRCHYDVLTKGSKLRRRGANGDQLPSIVTPKGFATPKKM